MNTHLRLGNAAGPLGLRRQDVVAFCIWVAILIASACIAIAQEAAPDTTFNPAALDSFFAGGSNPPTSQNTEAPAPHDTVAVPTAPGFQLQPADTQAAVATAQAPVETPPVPPAELARHLTQYQDDQLRHGAVTLPVAAQVEYRRALAALEQGDRDAALKHLQSALSLWPRYSDAYFTMARLYAQRFSPDAVYYMVEGVSSQLKTFDGQRVLAVNTLISVTLVLLLASGIVWIALAVRYFPFIAHRISESARNKFNATGGRVAAALLLLAPFALLPGYTSAAALILILTWPFMHKKERILSMVMAGMFAAFAGLAPIIDRYSVVADPESLTSLIARANESAGDEALMRAIEAAPVKDPLIEDDRYTAMGMLAMRSGDSETAAANFLRAISFNKSSAIAYVNLGNVYYDNDQFNKALEGYRKAEEVDSTDAVGQYNLAQAYIKTLLMGESSRALSRASKMGLDGARDAIAEPARARMSVYQKTYASAQLWEIAGVEGKYHNPALIASFLKTATGHSAPVSAIIMVAAMILAVVVSQTLKSRKLAFQCANCGDLTCEGCCSDELGSVICRSCAEAVAGVSSDRVLEALLRQRRQSVIVRRRKSIRWSTVWLPGLRHVFYGRFVSGFVVAAVFATGVLTMWTRGNVFPFWDSVEFETPLWKWIVPGAAVVVSYLVALMSRQLFEARNTRTVTVRGSTHTEDKGDSASQSA
jgi:tetratricopeptide (TPR) repeat protein